MRHGRATRFAAWRVPLVMPSVLITAVNISLTLGTSTQARDGIKLPSCRSRLHVWRNHIYAERLRRPVRILDDDINLNASAHENDIRYPQCGAVAVRRDTDHVCARRLNRCRHARLQV